MLRFLFVLVILFISGCQPQNRHSTTKLSGDPTPRQYQFFYALRQDDANHFTVIRVNSKTLEVISKIPAKHTYHGISIDADGNALLNYSMNYPISEEKDVDIIRYGSNRIEKFITTQSYGPSKVIPLNCEYAVVTGGHRLSNLNLEFYNQTGQFIVNTHLDDFAFLIDSIAIYNNSLLIITDASRFSTQNISTFTEQKYAFVSSVDPKTKKQNFVADFSKYFCAISGIAIDSDKAILYVASRTMPNKKNIHQSDEINTYIYVFNLNNNQLIKKIQSDQQPFQLTLVESQKKLYVSHQTGISLIDTNKMEKINTLEFSTKWMFSVAGNKLVLSHNDYDRQDHRLIVLDTRTDKVIKEYPGEFGPVSQCYY